MWSGGGWLLVVLKMGSNGKILGQLSCDKILRITVRSIGERLSQFC